MAFEIPRSRVLSRIQTQKRNVPIDKIIEIESQRPLATGIETFGKVIGDSLQQRAALRKQGEQLAKMEQLGGLSQGSLSGLDPSTAASFASASMKNRQEGYTPQQLSAIYSGDPNAISTAFPSGVPREAATLASTTSSRDENRLLRKEQMGALEEERERNRLEKRSKERTDIVSKFNTDPGVRKIQSSVDAASNVRELALSGNPIAASAIPTYMARASGEVGNLSEADKRPFGGSQAILSRLEASLKQMANGTLTESNRKFIMNLSDTMESSAINNLDRRAKDVSNQYGEASDFLKSDEIYKTLRPIVPQKPKVIKERDVSSYAEKHGISYEEAMEIKRQRTGGK